jgi:hypothetical protein
MENNKQTAVNYLLSHIWTTDWVNYTREQKLAVIEQAKEMEKERIETAYNKGTVHGIDYPESTLPITGEQYYNETYGGDKQ